MALNDTEQTCETHISATVVVGRFRNREDAHRAVIELREVEFPAGAIGAAYRAKSGETAGRSQVSTGEATSNPAKNDQPLKPVLHHIAEAPPDTPITSLTGGSPFGEASTYRPPTSVETDEDWWEGMRIALPPPVRGYASQKTAATSRKISPPTDINFEPSDRPAPAYERDDAGDYAYEGRDLESTLLAAGVGADHARSVAHGIAPGETLVTVRVTDRVSEAEAILRRNNGSVHDEAASTPPIDPMAIDLQASGGEDRLHLFGEVLRIHAERTSQTHTSPRP
jgi:hypothetical protein